jgi:AAA15 family ATPase/GTPase
MIVSFSVSNFRSFLSEETLSLVASKRLSGSHEEHAVAIPDSDERVLRAAVLYGANGAGKSNLFKALEYVESVALESREKNTGTGRQAFRFNGAADEPSTFDLQFIAEGKLFRFVFKANDQRITEESLVQVEHGKEKILYERITDESGSVTINAPGLKEGGEKLNALARVGGPQNQSFLATVQVTLETPDYGDQLGGVITWFRQSLHLVQPDGPFVALGHRLASDMNLKEFADDFLKSSSTGVDHLKVLRNEITEDELRSFLNKKLAAEVLKGVTEDQGAIVRLDEGNELVFERSGENHYYRITIQAEHEHVPGKVIPLELNEESDGTRRLLNLIPALHRLHTGNAVFFIDEIDRSLHPILVMKFLEFFLKSCKGAQRQIIVTTHESNLLDLELLRRDEIWFAEKDDKAATRLYSLADFNVRKDLEIRKHYLQGRFGAVPFLGNLDRLLAEQVKPE